LWSSGAVEQVSREKSGKVATKRAKTSVTLVAPNQYENIQLTLYFSGLLILNKDNHNYRYKTRILCCLFYNAWMLEWRQRCKMCCVTLRGMQLWFQRLPLKRVVF
jgi:hypothetical protein